MWKVFTSDLVKPVKALPCVSQPSRRPSLPFPEITWVCWSTREKTKPGSSRTSFWVPRIPASAALPLPLYSSSLKRAVFSRPPPRAETQRRGGERDPRPASVHPLHVHPPRRLPERRSQAQVSHERRYRRGEKGHLGEAPSRLTGG